MVKDLEGIISAMKKKGHKINEDPNTPNIVGIRTVHPTNEFNDRLVMFWRDEEGEWDSEEYTVTTDPGHTYLRNPPHKKGTAILREGQYIGAFKHGVHNNGRKVRAKAILYSMMAPFLPRKLKEKLAYMGRSHRALVQTKPLSVYRDSNKDLSLDMDEETVDTGMHNINIHRNHPYMKKKHVDDASAGCQVFQDPTEFGKFMKLLKGKLYRLAYDYTLLRDSDVEAEHRAKKQYQNAA
jgi:hypothetical protein